MTINDGNFIENNLLTLVVVKIIFCVPSLKQEWNTENICFENFLFLTVADVLCLICLRYEIWLRVYLERYAYKKLEKK